MSDVMGGGWVALAIGVSVGGMAWWFMASWRAVPRAERVHWQIRLPTWWRMLWPMANVCAWYAGPLIWPGARRRLEARLRSAGLAPWLEPRHVAGAQLALALVASGLAASVWPMLGGSVTLRTFIAGTALAAVCGAALPRLWLRDQIMLRRARVVRALPFVLDMTTLCVEGGLNLHGALRQAAEKGPPGPLQDELQRMLGDIRAGMGRAEALRQLAARLDEPVVRAWTTALIQAEALGMNLGPLLRAQADQRRTERFLRAEKLALEAPVKMLFPLIAFIFPCTFIVIAFPIAVKVLDLAG